MYIVVYYKYFEISIYNCYKRICIIGTAEYTQGLVEHVTVLVGVAIGETAIGGVIHQPYYKNEENDTYIENGRTLWGINGAGFGGFTLKLPPEGKRIITTTRYLANNFNIYILILYYIY